MAAEAHGGSSGEQWFRATMTFAPRCLLCGGDVEVWGEYIAVCRGFCKSKQKRLEDMTPAEFRRMSGILQRVLAIENASTVEVKGDVL